MNGRSLWERMLWGHLWPSPPPLAYPYQLMDYYWFMRREIGRYSPRYARSRVRIEGSRGLLDRHGGGILAFVHYGSFFLSGGAIVHQWGLPYTAMVSRRNLTTALMSAEDIVYWRAVHRIAARLYRQRLLFSDESPRGALRWLKGGGWLGMAMDVREIGQRQKEYPFTFMGERIHMQCGPARLARLAGVPLIPMAIQYDVAKRMHVLRFGEAIEVSHPVEATQRALDFHSEVVARDPAQQFHDMIATFKEPWGG